MDFAGWTALVTATLGGVATLIVAIATLVETVRGNRKIDKVGDATNGRLTELMEEVRLAAYLQGHMEATKSVPPIMPLPPAARNDQGDKK